MAASSKKLRQALGPPPRSLLWKLFNSPLYILNMVECHLRHRWHMHKGPQLFTGEKLLSGITFQSRSCDELWIFVSVVRKCGNGTVKTGCWSDFLCMGVLWVRFFYCIRELKFEKFVLRCRELKFMKFCDLLSILCMDRVFYSMHIAIPTSFRLTVKVVTDCHESLRIMISPTVNEAFQFSADIIAFISKLSLCWWHSYKRVLVIYT